MSLFDSIPVPTKKIVSKYKYYVKDHNDPIPFGKHKGKTLLELHHLGVTGGYFQWCWKNKLFGKEEFWSEKTIKIYKTILSRPDYRRRRYRVDYDTSNYYADGESGDRSGGFWEDLYWAENY